MRKFFLHIEVCKLDIDLVNNHDEYPQASFGGFQIMLNPRVPGWVHRRTHGWTTRKHNTPSYHSGGVIITNIKCDKLPLVGTIFFQPLLNLSENLLSATSRTNLRRIHKKLSYVSCLSCPQGNIITAYDDAIAD